MNSALFSFLHIPRMFVAAIGAGSGFDVFGTRHSAFSRAVRHLTVAPIAPCVLYRLVDGCVPVGFSGYFLPHSFCSQFVATNVAGGGNFPGNVESAEKTRRAGGFDCGTRVLDS